MEILLQKPQLPDSPQKTVLGLGQVREQWGPYQVEGLVGVLESQEHVLEDRQGGPPNDGVQELREDLKKSSRQGPPDLSHSPKPSVATVDPEREAETQSSGSSGLTMKQEQRQRRASRLDGTAHAGPGSRG